MLPFGRMIEYGNSIPIKNGGIRTEVLLGQTNPSARYSFGYTSYDNYGYIYGGAILGNAYNNEFWRYNFSTNVFDQLPSGILSTHGSALCYHNNKIYMFGGYTGSVSNRFFVYDIISNTWSENTTSINKPSGRHHSRFIDGSNGKLYLYGSDNGSELYSYEVSTDSWIQLSNSPVVNNLAGDMCSDGQNLYTNDCIYNIGTNTWLRINSSMGRMTYSTYDKNIYCVSGGILQRYNSSNNIWETVGNNISNSISRGSLYSYNNELYYLYGFSNAPTNKIYKFL